MKEKFTRGNWKIFNERVGIVDKSDSQSNEMMQEIAYVDMYNFGEQESKANAQLIACAPDMHEMLEQSKEMLENFHRNTGSLDAKAKAEEIESLLKRARGE